MNYIACFLSLKIDKMQNYEFTKTWFVDRTIKYVEFSVLIGMILGSQNVVYNGSCLRAN